MLWRTWLFPAILFFVTISALTTTWAAPERVAQPEGVRALDGEWVYFEDRTEGREVEAHQPSMSSRVRLRVDEQAVVLIRSDGEVRMALDGTPTDVKGESWVSRYRGGWKDGAFEYSSEPVRDPNDARSGGGISWVLRPTPDGLVASVETDSGWKSVALYRHPQDITMPTLAKVPGGIKDLEWLAGSWKGTTGTTGTTSIEERWSPPLGGAMLAVSRTVSRDRMRAFEYLRIVEREGGLVYIAQPNGRPPTEFLLTEISEKRAVFENPRHDSPQRIVYELSVDGGLTASIGYANGGKPRRFEYKREEN